MKRLILSSLFLFSFTFPLCASDLNPLLETSVKYGKIKVVRAITVDTLLLENDEKVSLIGIEGPKPVRLNDVTRDEHGFIIPEEDPKTPLELEALRYVKGRVEGHAVRLEFDAQRLDEGGVRTAYVFLEDGTMLNEEVLRQGYADLKLRMPNVKYADRFRKAYQEARREMRGFQGEW